MKRSLLILILTTLVGTFLCADQLIEVTNFVNSAIKEIYISASIADEWGSNLLTEGVLPPDKQTLVSIEGWDDETFFDLKAVDAYNNVYTIFELNLYENPSIEISEEGIDNYGGYIEYADTDSDEISEYGEYDDQEYIDYDSSYQEGYTEGHNQGYEEGYAAAYSEAFQAGFQAGLEAAREQ